MRLRPDVKQKSNNRGLRQAAMCKKEMEIGVKRHVEIFSNKWMKSVVLLGLIVQLFLAPSASARNNKWNRVVTGVNHEVEQAKEDARVSGEIVKEEKRELLGVLSRLRDSVEVKEKKLNQLKEEFEKLRQKQEAMEEQLQAEQEDIHTLEGAVKASAKDFDRVVQTSLITPEYPGLMRKVEELATSERFPSYRDIQELVEALFAYMKASGEILKREGKFIDKSGRESTGEMVRIGDFMAVYQKKGEVGCLRYDPSTGLLMAYPGHLPWTVRRLFKKYIRGSAAHLPLDLSHGALFKELTVDRGIMEWLSSGGFLVWPILLIGIVAAVLIGERIVFLSRTKKTSDRVTSEIDRLIQSGQFEECRKFCEKYIRVPVCRVVRSGLENVSASRDVLENALQEAILKELPGIEKFLPTLNVLAAIAPLLGLLGTVTGMIDTFQVITRFGTGDPRMMSGGISEALVTTQLGLGVAIPILLMHHFLERKAEKIIDEMEEKGTALTVTILKANER